ncbi:MULTISPECIES: serine hydrolase [Sphingobacterium]|uniref:serine hydrolase n=1 Tax=Sphingobacterium TaxID=28453 RepID=UPI0013DBCC1D|nr:MULTISPECIES: serine hydrolase [unclassified Sphingobacterium]
MKRLTLALCLLLHITVFAQKKQQPTLINRLVSLEKTFDQILKDWHMAGFSVAVVQKDKVIYAKGFGYRDVEKKLPVDANTLFAIGSCSKAFTGALIGQLVDEKKIDLDKPAISYLPNLKFYNDQMNNLVTVRDMLAHTTGLPRHDFSWYFFPSHSRDSLISRIQYLEPSSPIRTKWQYNNFMYTALGHMDEYLTKNSWEQDVKQRIFIPLDMYRSNSTLAEWKADPNAAVGYTVKNDSAIKKMDYYDIAGMGPAGAINSSANDMANWLKAWINDGKFEEKEVIPARYRREAISSQAIVSPGVPGKEKPDLMFSNYGFGWGISSYKGHYRVEHGGNIDGFSANTVFFPTDSLGIVVLSNQNNSSSIHAIRNIIADAVLGLPSFDWNADLLKELKKAKSAKDSTDAVAAVETNRPATHPLVDYSGSYLNPGYGTVKIDLISDSLFVTGSKKFWLKHNNFNSFDLIYVDPSDGIDPKADGTMTAQFNLNTRGEISNLSIPLEGSTKPIDFKRQLGEIKLSEEDLQKFVGDYSLSDMTVKLFVKNNKTLYALVPGQPEYELLAVGKDKFAIKVLPEYYLQFAANAQGQVIQVTFMQPNGNYIAKKTNTNN